jgi:Protein of unknown function (DUF420)
MRLFPSKGFFGTGATFAADLNLMAQLIMVSALFAGAFLARRKRYTAHGICQATVLLLNLVTIGFFMAPTFGQQVRPGLPKVFHHWYYAAAAFHALIGVMAEIFGIYVALVAGTRVLPQWLRFKDWKLWMRVELILWCVALLTGIGTYYVWYIAPFR